MEPTFGPHDLRHSDVPPALAAAIASFVPDPAWATVHGAWGQCEAATAAFADHCLAVGLDDVGALSLTNEGDDGRPAQVHVIGRVGAVTIDWTARQFGYDDERDRELYPARIPFPLVRDIAWLRGGRYRGDVYWDRADDVDL